MAVDFGDGDHWSLDDRIAELTELADSAGAEVVGVITQNRSQPDAAFFIGRGKLMELREAAVALDASLAIFDHDLTPAQLTNLENSLDLVIVDRTQLILDIFAQRAQTREGKLQVELAQLRYLLPRLTGRGAQLSRLGAGIGTRGPGETKLETDRRRIRQRIRDINEALEKVKKDRRLRRQRRQANNIPMIALVGYTNTGKSTLLQALTGEETFIADQLFATLDPKTRRLELPNKVSALLTDTVGFIHGLPHQLVAAFRATLEHVVDADMLLHVVDITHPRVQETVAAVKHVLVELGAQDKPMITVLNKIDRLNAEELRRWRLFASREFLNPVLVSAINGVGLDELRQMLYQRLSARWQHLDLTIPYDRLNILETLYKVGHVLTATYTDSGVKIEATLHPATAAHVKKLVMP